nr:unnamed protein product [Digitaria exilis]
MPLPAEPTYGSYSGSYTEQRVQRPGYGFQPQVSNLGLRGNYQGVSSNHNHAGNTIDDPASAAQEFQRCWAPPQPPGIIMPEAAAAIRQPRSVPRQQSLPADGRPSTDIPRPSEPAITTTEQMNGASGAHGGELSADGGTVTANASGSGGSEEQQDEDA